MYQSRNFNKLINSITINKVKTQLIKDNLINISNKESVKKEPSKCPIDYNNMICLKCGYDFCNEDKN